MTPLQTPQLVFKGLFPLRQAMLDASFQQGSNPEMARQDMQPLFKGLFTLHQATLNASFWLP